MHWLFAAQAFCPPGHVHSLPGLAQVSPWILQSFVVQHAPTGMQTSPAKHAVLLGGQLRTHCPAWHTWSAPQALPHWPQLSGSVCRFAQVRVPPSSLHWVCGGVQFAEHAPLTQNCPAAHALPQVPQLFGSVCVLAHPPSHCVCWLVQPPPLLLPAPSPLPPSWPPELLLLLAPPLEVPSSPASSVPAFSLPAPFAHPTATRRAATTIPSATKRPQFPIAPALLERPPRAQSDGGVTSYRGIRDCRGSRGSRESRGYRASRGYRGSRGCRASRGSRESRDCRGSHGSRESSAVRAPPGRWDPATDPCPARLPRPCVQRCRRCPVARASALPRLRAGRSGDHRPARALHPWL